MTTRRRARRLLAGLLVGTTAGLLGATAASAHVRVSGTDTAQGGYGVLTFRVPTESDTASTTGLTVTLPTDSPIAYAATQPMPGWTAEVRTARLPKPVTTADGTLTTFVRSVTWTARSAKAGIRPGQFQEFRLSAGPLPKRATVVLPALQRYSDGSEVNWNQVGTGSAEPEHPAPVLALAAGAATVSATAAPTVRADGGATTATRSDGAGTTLGAVGAGLGLLALVVALVALVRSGRRGPAGP